MAASERVALTKAHLTTEAARSLVALCLEAGLDGDLSDGDVTRISNFVFECKEELPAIRHLRALLSDALADGMISNAERALLHRQIERVLPPTERERLKLARQEAESKRPIYSYPPSEAQLRYISNLGGKLPPGASKSDASLLIDQLLHGNGSITVRQRMVLRFWNRTPEPHWGKPDVSAWMDGWYLDDPDRLAAWELFKESTGDTGNSSDPERVPLGCGDDWLAKVKQPRPATAGRPSPTDHPKSAGTSGCLSVVIIVFVFVAAAGSAAVILI